MRCLFITLNIKYIKNATRQTVINFLSMLPLTVCSSIYSHIIEYKYYYKRKSNKQTNNQMTIIPSCYSSIILRKNIHIAFAVPLRSLFCLNVDYIVTYSNYLVITIVKASRKISLTAFSLYDSLFVHIPSPTPAMSYTLQNMRTKSNDCYSISIKLYPVCGW